MLKEIGMFFRALVTAPDVAHWIKKYEAAKEEIRSLNLQLAELERKEMRKFLTVDQKDSEPKTCMTDGSPVEPDHGEIDSKS